MLFITHTCIGFIGFDRLMRVAARFRDSNNVLMVENKIHLNIPSSSHVRLFYEVIADDGIRVITWYLSCSSL